MTTKSPPFMSHYATYMSKQLFAPILLTAFMLGGMAWIVQAVRLLELIGGQTESALTYLGLTLLSVPRILTFILPISVFCGTYFGLNRLTLDSELIVMSATGQSRWQLATPCLLIAGVVSLFMLLCNLWLSPFSLQKLRDYRHVAQNDIARTLIKDGAFHNPSRRLTVHSKYRTEDGTYHGFLLHDARARGQAVTYIAREATILKSDEGPPQFLLIDGSIHTPSENGAATILTFKEYVHNLNFIAPPSKQTIYEAKERYLPALLFPDKNRPYDRTFHGELVATGHQHIASAFQPIVMVLICCAVLFTGTMDRRRQTQRLVIGGGLAVAYLLLSFAILGLAANNPHYIWLIYGLALCGIGASGLWLHYAPDMARLMTRLMARFIPTPKCEKN